MLVTLNKHYNPLNNENIYLNFKFYLTAVKCWNLMQNNDYVTVYFSVIFQNINMLQRKRERETALYGRI